MVKNSAIELYRSTSILCGGMPETYNFVVREALESGCLVVGSALGAISEVISPERNGFLFSPYEKVV